MEALQTVTRQSGHPSFMLTTWVCSVGYLSAEEAPGDVNFQIPSGLDGMDWITGTVQYSTKSVIP